MALFELYVVYNRGGQCLYHYKFGGLEVKSDLVCPFLDALSTFVMETIPSQGKMRLLDKEDVKILFERGSYVTTALFASDSSPETRQLLSLFLSLLEREYGGALMNWDGALDAFSSIDKLVESVFKKETVLQQPIPPDLMPKTIKLSEVVGSRIDGRKVLTIIRTAIQEGVSGILSISLDSLKFDPVGYISILNGKGYASLYAGNRDKARRGNDATRHIIFDSVALSAWLKFRFAGVNEIETESDRTANRIDDPLYRIALDSLLLMQRYEDIRNSRPRLRKVLSANDVHNIISKFGEAGVGVLKSSQGTVKLDELVAIHGLSSLEVTEILVWAAANGLIEI
jgi:hypothetical protein